MTDVVAAKAAVIPVKGYMAQALEVLSKLGLSVTTPESTAAYGSVVGRLAVIDEPRTVSVLRVLQAQAGVSEVVNRELGDLKQTERYAEIAAHFDSIIEDATRMVEQVKDGKIDAREKLANFWMSLTRGSIPTRFAKIKQLFGEVTGDAGVVIERAETVLNAYGSFRLGMKQAEVEAGEILKSAEARVEAAKALVGERSAAVDADDKSDPARLSTVQLARDEAVRALQQEDQILQTARSLLQNMVQAYASTEFIFARCAQFVGLKRAVYDESVMFFGTNQLTLSGLDAAFTLQASLHEDTKTLTATRAGVGKGLEALATVGGEVLTQAQEAAYGPGVQASSVAMLIDATVKFQESTVSNIARLRQLSDENTAAIRSAEEDGKRRISQLLSGAQ